MCWQGKSSCECAGNSPHLMRSEPGNPERADPEGVQALSVLTKPFFFAGATSQGKHLPKADFRGTALSLLSGFECSHVLLGAGHNTAKNGGQEKNLLRGGNPSLAQASARCCCPAQRISLQPGTHRPPSHPGANRHVEAKLQLSAWPAGPALSGTHLP